VRVCVRACVITLIYNCDTHIKVRLYLKLISFRSYPFSINTKSGLINHAEWMC